MNGRFSAAGSVLTSNRLEVGDAVEFDRVKLACRETTEVRFPSILPRTAWKSLSG